MVSAPFRRAAIRRGMEQVIESIEAVLTLLQDASEEARAKATVAIPDTINALANGDMAMQNWREVIASRIYDDWCRRTGQNEKNSYFHLSKKDQEPFLRVVEAVVQVQSAK